jgi:hypothetical protein
VPVISIRADPAGEDLLVFDTAFGKRLVVAVIESADGRGAVITEAGQRTIDWATSYHRRSHPQAVGRSRARTAAVSSKAYAEAKAEQMLALAD